MTSKQSTFPNRDALEEVDRVCLSFEDALQAGECPEIKDYLGHVKSEYEEQLFIELLRIELEYGGCEKGTELFDIYVRRFPIFGDAIRRVLSGG